LRLDKYLKVSRLIKRRTIANEACDAGRVLVNNNKAKASYEVKVGDRITIAIGQTPVVIVVVSINEFARKEEAAAMYLAE
jgi:ribosomal 50S subunit-recycling heat shock protein